MPRLGAEHGVTGGDPVGAHLPIGRDSILLEAILDGHHRGPHKACVGVVASAPRSMWNWDHVPGGDCEYGGPPETAGDGRRQEANAFQQADVAWRGTPGPDDWVAYILTGTNSKKLILAAHTSERTVKRILTRIQGMSKREVEKLAKG